MKPPVTREVEEIRAELKALWAAFRKIVAFSMWRTGQPVAEHKNPLCCTGSKLRETEKLRAASTFDLMGRGLGSTSCVGKPFTENEQDLMADLSDCAPLASVSQRACCSVQDEIVTTIRDRFHFEGSCVDEGRM